MWSLICGLAVVGGQWECPAKCTEDQGKMTSRDENGRDEQSYPHFHMVYTMVFPYFSPFF
jgi:hypothetical protein